MSSDKSDMGSNVKVVGLMGMGLSLMLIGLSLLPAPYGNGFAGFWAAIGTTATFGGLVLIVVGLIALWKNHTFWGSAFVSFGAFFTIWVATYAVHGAIGVQNYGLAGVSAVFALMTLTFLLSSMKHGWMTFFLYLFFLITVLYWLAIYWMNGAGTTVSNGELWGAAAITILTGLIAWYMATAALTNWSYGRKILPG